MKQTMEQIERVIRNRYRALLRASEGNIPKTDYKKIRMALNMLIRCNNNKTTLTGEHAVIHALSVARIVVSEIGLGTVSVMATLLNGCKEELEWPEHDILHKFGQSTLDVLTGLNKIEDIQTATSSYNADNFLKLILSLADDIRVILITLVDRLEYMRNLDGAEPETRLKIASESYFLYAPLSHRLGLYTLKSEMEDLAMKYLDPEAYEIVRDKIKQTAASRNRLIREFSFQVREKLDKLDFKYSIKSRTKSIHSIWQKMKKQGVDFKEVFDLFAIRIIIETRENKEKSDCWQVYSLVTDLYQPNPSRLRDWISVPKSNGYESLHTTVIGPKGKWVEVQIRTTRMDNIAEKGLAAHTIYKGLAGYNGLDAWLSRMREVLESPHDKEESVIDNVKSDFYSDEIIVFTPKGELRRLGQGATVLDFAFEIHSQVGATCAGGKVNGKNVSIRHQLNNGDKVEIITSKNQKPKQDWLSFVVTSKAKSRIKVALNEEIVKAAAEGKEILLRRLKNWKIEFNDLLVRRVIDHYELPNARELYYLIYNEKIDLLQIKEVLRESRESRESRKTKHVTDNIAEKAGQEDKLPENNVFIDEKLRDFLIIENKVDGLDYKLSQCCNPVMGDKVFGFVTITEGIKIHRINCPNAHYMMTNFPYRIIMARWTKGEEGGAFQTSVKISGINDHAMISKIHEVVSSYRVTLRNFNYQNNYGMFEGTVYLFVPNINTLNGLIKKLLSIKGVLKAVRIDR